MEKKEKRKTKTEKISYNYKIILFVGDRLESPIWQDWKSEMWLLRGKSESTPGIYVDAVFRSVIKLSGGADSRRGDSQVKSQIGGEGGEIDVPTWWMLLFNAHCKSRRRDESVETNHVIPTDRYEGFSNAAAWEGEIE